MSSVVQKKKAVRMDIDFNKPLDGVGETKAEKPTGNYLKVQDF